MIKSILFVGLGGAAGSILRYLVTIFSGKVMHSLHPYPIGTFIVNMVGCLLVGCLLGFFEQRQLLDSQLKILFVTGFCGSFTTFSAFSAEAIQLFESGNILIGVVYIGASIAFGLLAVWGGFLFVR